MNKTDVIARLKEVKPTLASKYNLRSLALFGSYSRNGQSPQSDIDLLIDLSGPNAADFFSCAFALQDLFQNQKVDIVTKGASKQKYFKAIEKDLLYA